MPESMRKHFHDSIVFKFLLVFVMSSILILVLLLGFFTMIMKLQTGNLFKKNRENYIGYLMQELGSPPDEKRAQAMAEKLSLKIRFEGPTSSWTTSPDLPKISDIKRIQARYGDLGQALTHHALISTSNQGSFLFEFEFKLGFLGREEIHFIFLLLCLAVVLTACWIWVKWLLKPISWLSEGVLQISQGHLNYRIPVRQKDELGRLAHSFNDMTRRIQEMLHSKQQLLLDVSHETRTPLTRMKLALEMMPASKNRSRIQADVAELEKMIDEILESGRMDSEYGNLCKEPVNLAELIRAVAKSYSKLKPEIHLSLEAADCSLALDAARIKKVMKNVLENAIKYSLVGSLPIEVSSRVEAKAVVIRIQDFGSGIPEPDLLYVFEPFYRVDRSRSKESGGFGLGLSICKRIMEAHGGCIFLNSQLHQGTMVELYFWSKPSEHLV